MSGSDKNSVCVPFPNINVFPGSFYNILPIFAEFYQFYYRNDISFDWENVLQTSIIFCFISNFAFDESYFHFSCKCMNIESILLTN